MKHLFETENAIGFTTLSVVREYAQSIQEYPESDNKNLFYPDFTSLYVKEEYTHLRKLLDTILIKVGFKPKPIWNIKVWADLLEELTIKREKDNYVNDFILKFSPEDKSRFIIWGDLNGAFHSLVRDCLELNRQGILSEELIISPNNYFVFNGNLIERAPYNLATLTLVMQLIKNNPKNVFYIKGKLESNNEWHNYALKNELKARASGGLVTEFLGQIDQRIPFENLLNRFFNTLPLAIYLYKQNEYLRISNFAGRKMEQYEFRYTDFFKKDSSNEIEMFRIQDKKRKNVEDYRFYTSIKAQIISVDRSISSTPTDGLELLIPEKGITSWSILSSPIETYQEIYSFYNDAFGILTISEDIYFWTLELNYQDVHELTESVPLRLKQKKFKQKKYTLLSGQITKVETRAAEKIKERLPDLVAGCSLDLSKSAGPVGFKLREGLALGATKENSSGGVLGRIFKIIFLDDKYTPYLAKKNVLNLMQNYKTDLVISPSGTPTIQACLDLVRSKQILVLFPYSGGTFFRNPELNYIVNFRTSYANEAKALMNYAINILQMRKLAVFYQNDSYGLSGLEGAREVLKKYPFVQWKETSYLRNNPKVSVAAQAIIEFNPEGILFISTYPLSVALMNSLDLEFLANKILMGISALTDSFRDFLTDKGLNFVVSRLVPPFNTDIEVVNEYKEDMQKSSWNVLNADSLEGYINALFFCHIAKSIEGQLTKEKIFEYISEFKNYNFKGLNVNFDPNTNELHKNIWLGTPTEWILSEKDWL